ncbi:MAG: GAF domain-containing protein [Spirochaetaceae bacterium]|nr:GAF domain-containing protein [Spirochaetaceae bacterium]
MSNLKLQQAIALLDGEPALTIAGLANVSSFIYHNFDNLNWAGFYLWTGEKLVLGPFNGQVACTVIAYGKGVCGGALAQKQTLVVPNVHDFEGHIACDSRSQSEIVVPLFLNDQPLGVLDIDSPILNRFSSEDKAFFEELAQNLVTICGKNMLKLVQN